MAPGNFTNCLPTILVNEGGLSMLRSDPGNWTGGKVGVGELRGTNMGIAACAHPDLNIPELSEAAVASIYERSYWMPAGCETLPPGLDLSHFDATVNSGRDHAERWLHDAASGELPDRIREYASSRLHSLESWRIWATFGRGLAERVARVERRSLAMACDDDAQDRIKEAGAAAIRVARSGTIAAHASTAAATAAISVGAQAGHPIIGVLVGLCLAISSIWNAFRASVSNSRAAILSSQEQV